MLVTFEKKIAQNQKQRIKYADEPAKFMESEYELNQEIQNLHVVAAYPSLYPIILQNQSLYSILGMITHENTDISIMAVSLLQEMIDASSLAEAREEMMALIESFIALNGLELITQNLNRLNEFDSSEDAQGVYNTLAILDSLMEINSDHAVAISMKTNIVSFLVKRITNKEHDANKVYASEVLSILTQHAPNEIKQLVLAEEDLLDSVLQSIAHYRKKDIVGKTEEQELVENIFLTLNTLLTSYVDIQDLFLKLEGLELLLRCWQFQEYVAFCSVTTMNLALLHHSKACQHFVDIAGLKYLFAYLTLIGKPSHHKYKKVILQKQEALEDSMVSIVSSLCVQLSLNPASDYNKRLLVKLIENNYEKLIYICTLYVKYDSVLRKAESEMVRVKEQLETEGEEEELEELLDPDNLYLEVS
ncbi:hypothetical protein EON65_04530 [archaeon]|nr:MAG: hypothetical protein EON65_04530 [archaeon]